MLLLVAAIACTSDQAETDTGVKPSDSGQMSVDTGTPDTGNTPADSGMMMSSMDASGDLDASEPMDAAPGADGGEGMDAAVMGACTNQADMDLHNNTDVQAGVETCASDCFGGRPCMRMCLTNDVGLSMECAECYVEVTSCTIQNCLSECAGSDRSMCEMCRDDSGCTAGFLTCAGFQ
jgi:hypothetical protein